LRAINRQEIADENVADPRRFYSNTDVLSFAIMLAEEVEIDAHIKTIRPVNFVFLDIDLECY